jgi:hypothetical protein
MINRRNLLASRSRRLYYRIIFGARVCRHSSGPNFRITASLEKGALACTMPDALMVFFDPRTATCR